MQQEQRRLAAILAADVAGYSRLMAADESGAVLIGYAMYEQFEGHGYATEVVRAMIAWAFRQPGVKQVRTLAPVWNTPALRVAENVGMRPVAACVSAERTSTSACTLLSESICFSSSTDTRSILSCLMNR